MLKVLLSFLFESIYDYCNTDHNQYTRIKF